jgi:hypothetical protein
MEMKMQVRCTIIDLFVFFFFILYLKYLVGWQHMSRNKATFSFIVSQPGNTEASLIGYFLRSWLGGRPRM